MKKLFPLGGAIVLLLGVILTATIISKPTNLKQKASSSGTICSSSTNRQCSYTSNCSNSGLLCEKEVNGCGGNSSGQNVYICVSGKWKYQYWIQNGTCKGNFCGGEEPVPTNSTTLTPIQQQPTNTPTPTLAPTTIPTLTPTTTIAPTPTNSVGSSTLSPTCVPVAPTCPAQGDCPQYILCQQPSPTCTPEPPQCIQGSNLGINCPAIPPGGWCPINPNPSGPTTTVSPGNLSTAAIQVSFSILGIPDQSNQAIPNHTTRKGSIDFVDSNNNVTPVNTTFNFDNTQGVFTANLIAAVPPGIYLPKIDVPGYLHKALPLITVAQTTAIQSSFSASLVNGDIDGDNSLNILDFQALFACYNKAVATNPQCTPADLNDDGNVDAVDFNIFLRSFSTQHGD